MNEEKNNLLDLLNKTGRIVYTNKGISMMPLLRQGKDLMIIEKCNGSPNLWDAVLFERPNGQLILHRILKKEVKNGKNYYWIVGDNCIFGEWVEEKDIHGVLVGIRRNGKKYINVSDRNYKLYLALWAKPYRFRIFVTKIKLKINHIFHFLFRIPYRLFVKPFRKKK